MKKFFSSPKLTFILLIILALVSIIGTIIPQNAEPCFYLEKYGHNLYSLFKALSLIDVYHSWWFIGLLGFLSLDIIICSLNRFKTAWKGKLGSFIIHLSILIILLGGIISSLVGFKEYLYLKEAEVSQVPQTNFYIKLNKFWLEYYSDSRVIKDYKSNLTIIEDGKEILAKTIEVNYPLSYKRIRFYQANYGIDTINEVTIAIQGKDFRVKIGEEFGFPDADLKIKVADFVPDFAIDEGKVFSRSNELDNPAVLLEVYEDATLKYKKWVFYKFPGFHHKDEKDTKFILKDFHPSYYTGLQVVKDPAREVVWIGCILLMIGLIISMSRNLEFSLSLQRMKP